MTEEEKALREAIQKLEERLKSPSDIKSQSDIEDETTALREAMRRFEESRRMSWRVLKSRSDIDEQPGQLEENLMQKTSEQGELPAQVVQRLVAALHSPLVGVIMGSKSDWETMQHTTETLDSLGVPYEVRIVSAHRTPDLLFEYAAAAEERGLAVIVAGAGGAAHLPGMCAAKTALPVLGVPVESKALKGMDSLLSIVQMPAGIPVATLAIGRAGAINAALLATAILANKYPQFREALHQFRTRQTQAVLENPDPRIENREG